AIARRTAASPPLSGPLPASNPLAPPLSTMPCSARKSGRITSAEARLSSSRKLSSSARIFGLGASAGMCPLYPDRVPPSAAFALAVQRLGQVQQPTARALVQLVVGAHQVQGLLAGQDLGRLFGLFLLETALLLGQPVVEIGHRHLQRFGKLPQPCSGDAVGAALVFLDLLEADAAGASQLLLGQAEQAPAPAQPLAQVNVDLVAHGPRTHTVTFLPSSQSGTLRALGGKSRATRARFALHSASSG